MSAPKVLDPGRYAVTVPARSDAAFVEWRTANKARVGIRQVRQSSDYSNPPPSEYPALFTVPPEPAGIATYEVEVTQGPALPVPVIDGGGFETLGKPGGLQNLDDLTPTSSPEYHANEVPDLATVFTPAKVATTAGIVVVAILGGLLLWKRFFSSI
jgi:hypothetical protein